VQALKNRKWEVARVFSPEHKRTADSLYASLTAKMGYDGKKLIAEVMDAEGMVRAKTLSVQVFDPSAAKDKKAAPPRSGGPGMRGHEPAKDFNPFRPLFAFLSALGKHFKFGEISWTSPLKTKPVAKFGNPAKVKATNRRINEKSTAYETKYPDETSAPKDEVVNLENQEILGADFFNYIRANLINEDLTANNTQAMGVFCFTIGALVRIENGLDLASDRGRVILHNTLGMLMFSSEDIEDFMGRMMSLLTHDGSRRFLKAGARCLEYHQTARSEDLITTFRKTFGLVESEDEELGVTEDIGIIFTDIVDSTKLNSEIGDFQSQKVVDHHEAILRGYCSAHGGRILKHLGDGFMLAFSDSGEMVKFLKAVLTQYRDTAAPADVEPYKIRLGGHYGQAIEKNGDYFGSTVSLAARIAAKARDMQGALLNEYREVAEANGLHVADQMNAELKGFKDKFTIILLA
jgi:class 3 adenylate cyclase